VLQNNIVLDRALVPPTERGDLGVVTPDLYSEDEQADRAGTNAKVTLVACLLIE